MKWCLSLLDMKKRADGELGFFNDSLTLADRTEWIAKIEDDVFRNMASFFVNRHKRKEGEKEGIGVYMCYVGPRTFEAFLNGPIKGFNQYVYVPPDQVPPGMLSEDLLQDRKIRGMSVFAEVQIEVSLTNQQDVRRKKLLLVDKPRDVVEPRFETEREARKFMAKVNLPPVGKKESAKNMLNSVVSSIKKLSPEQIAEVASRAPPGYAETTLHRAMRICFACKKGTVTAKLCGRCMALYYCSKECQAQDWGRHKKECAKK